MSYIIAFLITISCTKIEIYYKPHDYEIHIIPQIEQKYDIDDRFIYFWSDGEWGDIGYKKQKTIYEDLYIKNKLVISKLANQDPFQISSTDIIDCVISTYNLQNTDHSYILTTPLEKGDVFDFLTQYPIHQQPEEIWCNSIKSMSCEIEGYNWELMNDYFSRPVYIKLKPQSFIYVIQIVIYNDKETLPWRETQCDSLILSGMSSTRNIKTQKSNDDKCNILCEIKPGQNRLDKMVFCSRVVTFGLPSSYQDGSSWNISQTLECYIGFKVVLFNNIERRVKVNISNRMREIPEGGLINIELNYSEIYTENGNTGGIDVGVGDWSQDEIYINI